MANKILITGPHGFVGTNLIQALDDCQIVAVSRSDSPVNGVGRFFTWNDLDNPELWNGVDTVVHLAAFAHDTKYSSSAEQHVNVNTTLAEKVYDAFCRSSATKFIFLSSVKALADTVLGDVLTEDVAPAPVGPYGKSKLAAEQYILKNQPAQDKQVYILRPCLIYGRHCKGNLRLLVRFVKTKLPWPLAAWDNKRSMLAIDNLIYVIKRIINGGVAPGQYNLADDEPVSTNHLIRVISWAAVTETKLLAVPKPIIKAMARVGTWLHLPLNDLRLKKLTESYVVDNSKIRAALDLEKMPADSRTALRDAIASLL